jgi:hypothetical protein
MHGSTGAGSTKEHGSTGAGSTATGLTIRLLQQELYCDNVTGIFLFLYTVCYLKKK